MPPPRAIFKDGKVGLLFFRMRITLTSLLPPSLNILTYSSVLLHGVIHRSFHPIAHQPGRRRCHGCQDCLGGEDCIVEWHNVYDTDDRIAGVHATGVHCFIADAKDRPSGMTRSGPFAAGQAPTLRTINSPLSRKLLSSAYSIVTSLVMSLIFILPLLSLTSPPNPPRPPGDASNSTLQPQTF